MSKSKSDFDAYDTPYEVQPPSGSAEGPIEYGGVVGVAAKGNMKDPMGVLPEMVRGKNIGPQVGEG
jgi:hypothetical protein